MEIEVHYCAHEGSPLAIPRQINFVHIISYSFNMFEYDFSHTKFSFYFFVKNSLYVSCLPHVRYIPPYLILLDQINLSLFGVDKLWSSSLSDYLQPLLTSCFFDLSILLRTLFSSILNV
jgi:hypothetical protein